MNRNIILKLSLLIFLLITLTSNQLYFTSCNRGGIIFEPTITVDESSQNAIIAWDGEYELLILSTNLKSSKSTIILEIMPLPSNPILINKTNFNIFKKLASIYNEKVKVLNEKIRKTYRGLGGTPPISQVKITFKGRIGLHEITVVRVHNYDYFIDWINSYVSNIGFNHAIIDVKLAESIKYYLENNFNYYVFDLVKANESNGSVEPIIYLFKCPFIYYPLKITADSIFGKSKSIIKIFIITYGLISKSTVFSFNFKPYSGFRIPVFFENYELAEVHSEIAKMFPYGAYVMNIIYSGELSKLNHDIIVREYNVYSPSILSIPYRLKHIHTRSYMFKALSYVFHEILLINNSFIIDISITLVLVIGIVSILLMIFEKFYWKTILPLLMSITIILLVVSMFSSRFMIFLMDIITIMATIFISAKIYNKIGKIIKAKYFS